MKIKNRVTYLSLSIVIIVISLALLTKTNRIIGYYDQLRVIFSDTTKNTLNQTLFVSAICIYGAVLGFCFKDTLSLGHIVFLAPIFGTTAWFILSLILLITGIPYTALSIIVFFILLSTSMIVIKKPCFKSIELLDSLTIIAAYFSVSFLFSIIYMSYVSGDSYTIIALGNAAAIDQRFNLETIATFGSYSIITPLFFSAPIFFNFDFSNGFYLLYGLSFIISICYFIYIENKEYFSISVSILISFVAFFMLMTSGLFTQLMLIYPISNSTAICNMFLTMYFAYKSQENDKNLFFCGLFLMIFGLCRTESTLLALVILFIISNSKVGVKSTLKLTSTYLSALIIWYIKYFSIVGFDYTSGDFLTIQRASAIIAVYIVFIVYQLVILNISFFKDKQKLLNKLLFTLLFVALIFFLIVEPQKFINNISTNIYNIVIGGRWGASMLVLISVITIHYIFANKTDIWDMYLLSYIIGIFLIFMLREMPLRRGFGDSGNRMLASIVPIIVFISSTRLMQNLLPQSKID